MQKRQQTIPKYDREYITLNKEIRNNHRQKRNDSTKGPQKKNECILQIKQIEE